MLSGWSLTLAANAPTTIPDDTAAHIAFTATLAGGALGFLGLFAGISRWVAEPAARKVLREHTKEGADAHPSYISRSEWDFKHLSLANEVAHLSVEVAKLSGLVARQLDRQNESG
jgi:hypothetical protein